MIDFMNFQNLSSDLKPIHGLVVLHGLGVRVGLDLLAVAPVGLPGPDLFDLRCVTGSSFSSE